MKEEIKLMDQVKEACHELRNIKSAMETGIDCLKKTNTDRLAAGALCEQGLSRFETAIVNLENYLNSLSTANEEGVHS